MQHKFHLIIVAAALLIAPIAEAGGSLKYTNRRGATKSVGISESFSNPMQCVVQKLESKGYHANDIGCFGTRPRNRSAHPTGHACDVDQTARDVTQLNQIGRAAQKEFAQDCGAVSGCIWRNSDCGHFEARSAPYSAAGAGITNHYYGEAYASHPVRRRR